MILGKGTTAEPYQIICAEDLCKINEEPTAQYRLEKNLVLPPDFSPLASQFEPFTGVLDGNGHTISGLLLRHATQYAGLISYNKGFLKNLKLTDVDIHATAYVGALVGYNDGYIQNCTAAGSVRGTTYIGGLVGYNTENGQVSGKADCRPEGTLYVGETIGYYAGHSEQGAVKRTEILLYVSPNGDDEGTGEITSPLRTVLEAQARVRSLIAQNVPADIAVVLRQGRYYLEKPILITERDCFHNGQRITYRSYPEEQATLMGGKPINNWEKTEGGLLRAYAGEKWTFRRLFVNGILKRPAAAERWEEYSSVDLQHVYAYFSHGWFSEELKVTALNHVTRKISTAMKPSEFSGNASFLMGAIAFLQYAGDWALGTDGYLYYYPVENDPLEIYAPTVTDLFLCIGQENERVENIVVEGLRLLLTDTGESFTAQGGRGKEGFEDAENTHAALYFKNATRCCLRRNLIEHCSLNGISIQGSSSRIRIEENRIRKIGFAGIHCNGNWIDSPIYNNNHHVLYANHISEVGLFAVNGAGIYLLGSGHNHLLRNLIHDTPRYGISMKGARYGCWHTNCGQNLHMEITFERQWDYLHTRNNLIEGNEIYDAGKNSLDGGGIEAWGPGRDNVIDYNLVYDFYNGIPTVNWKGHGIFLDDATHYFNVTNNIVYESKQQGADASIFMKSIWTYVRNNIFDVTNTHQGAANISPYEEPCRDQVFANNIVYADPNGGIGEDGLVIENGSLDRRAYTYDTTAAQNQTGSPIARMDNNLYYNTKGRLFISRDNSRPEMDIPLEHFSREMHFDSNGLITDPLFVDARHRNYALLSESPAIRMGFCPIDQSRMGFPHSRRVNN